MKRHRIWLGAVALALLTTYAGPRPGVGQVADPADRIRELERQVEMLQRQVRQLNATIDQLTELMTKLNEAVGDPQVRKHLDELRAARQPATTGKARKLEDLSEEEKKEIKQLEGVVKISTNPIEDQGRLVGRLWDFCVYESAAKEMDKLLKAEAKVEGDRWHNLLIDRLNRELERFEKPAQAETFLKVALTYPLLQENEKGMQWLNNAGSASRKLYQIDPNKYKAYLARASRLYEASLKINPAQPDVKEALKSIKRAQADAEKAQD